MKQKVVLICGRENLSEDLNFQLQLIAFLQSQQVEIIYESEELYSNFQLSNLKKLIKRFASITRLNQLKCLLISPFNALQNLNKINGRICRIIPFLKSLNFDEVDLYVIGRSAGAIVASKLALDFPVKAIIALGYPFFHPKFGKQRYRINHLARINCPMLIFQGMGDIYGKPDQLNMIPLSPAIQVFPVETNHNFVLDDLAWKDFCITLSTVLNCD